VTREIGSPARVGLAGTRFCARVAAAYAAPVRVIPPGNEREFLAPLPLSHLPGLATWGWRLQFLGIVTIGDFAALPYADVVVRYGQAAAEAHLLARGLDPAPLQPRRPREPVVEVLRFEPPEARLEPLVFAPGPLQTADRAQWTPVSSKKILELKIADIAMGSAAFLVAAARYLGARLVDAWVREGDPRVIDYAARSTERGPDADDDPVVFTSPVVLGQLTVIPPVDPQNPDRYLVTAALPVGSIRMTTVS